MNDQTRVMLVAIADFLETESVPYKDDSKVGDISWNYPSDEHAPTMNPQGMVIVTRIRNASSSKNEYSRQKIYEIFLRLLISEATEALLIEQLIAWSEIIGDIFLPKLRTNGLSDTYTSPSGIEVTTKNLFKGITWQDTKPMPRINQDRGGTGAILVSCEWMSDTTLGFNI